MYIENDLKAEYTDDYQVVHVVIQGKNIHDNTFVSHMIVDLIIFNGDWLKNISPLAIYE